jgi:hypothetical protein
MAEAKNVVEQPTFGGIPLVYRPPMCAEDDSSEGDLIEAGDLLGKAIRCSGSGVSKYDDPDFPPPQVWSDD